MIFLSLFLTVSTALAANDVRREKICETLHQQKVCDPYRWMENVQSPEVREWVATQNSASRKILDQVPQRSKISESLKSFAAAVAAPPIHHKNGLFYIPSKGSLYSGSSAAKPETLLVDIPALFQNPFAGIAEFSLSPDGSKILLVVNFYGSDIPAEIVIYDIAKKQLIEKGLAQGASNYLGQNWIRGPFWLPDSQSYVYTKVTLGSLNAPVKTSLVRRQVGQTTEENLYENQTAGEDLAVWYGRPLKSGEYLLVQNQAGEQETSRFGLLPLKSPAKMIWVMKERRSHFTYMGDNGKSLFFRTNRGANNLKIIAIDFQKALSGKIEEKEIVPETDPIVTAGFASDRLFVVTMDPAQQQRTSLHLYDENGSFLKKIVGLGSGTLDSFRHSEQTGELFFQYNDYLQPRSLMSVDLKTLSESLINQPKAPLEKSDFTVKTLDLPETKDEPALQITLLEKAGNAAKKPAPLLLHFYGNLAGTLTPQYNPKFLTFLKMGGRVAIAHVRGGPDKGHRWVDGGRATNKQNTLNDAIRAAEFLQREGLTTPALTLVDGRSSGGFNVLVLANHRPDLFGVIASTVPMADMVRFPHFAWGNRWLYEYGDPKIKKEFKNLFRLSPYHNVKRDPRRPPMIIFTADHDDRVNPVHAYKATAALQHTVQNENPVLMVEDTNASHGSKVEALDELTFAADRMKIIF